MVKQRGDQVIPVRQKRIDEIDEALIELWRERMALSRQISAMRVSAGGTSLVMAREYEILARFRDALGSDGTQLALLLLRSGRGPV